MYTQAQQPINFNNFPAEDIQRFHYYNTFNNKLFKNSENRTHNSTAYFGCNTNQKQDLDCFRDMSCNTLDYDRNISTMTFANHLPMRDSTSSTSNEFGTMTKINFSKNVMKETSSEAKNEYEIGVMTNSKKKSEVKHSECNTLFDSEMGINCNMNEVTHKKDSTCDAKQFEEHIGTNTNKIQEKEFAVNTHKIQEKEFAVNT